MVVIRIKDNGDPETSKKINDENIKHITKLKLCKIITDDIDTRIQIQEKIDFLTEKISPSTECAPDSYEPHVNKSSVNHQYNITSHLKLSNIKNAVNPRVFGSRDRLFRKKF